jgi:hypothetical protein
VFEVTRRIQESDIFPDDKDLLYRIAWVESRFGWDLNDLCSDDGTPLGIWRMNKTALEDTKDVQIHGNLERKHAEILWVFDIRWKSITVLDLCKPLISGLAARLRLYSIGRTIPSKIDEQAKYWEKYYNNDYGTTAAAFLERLQGLSRYGAPTPIPSS